MAYSQTMTVTENFILTQATRVGLKGMGLDHLPESILRQIPVSPNWAYLLQAEIKKIQAQPLKLDEARLREDGGDVKRHIFDHSIRGVL